VLVELDALSAALAPFEPTRQHQEPTVTPDLVADDPAEKLPHGSSLTTPPGSGDD
jgi:hypothetical protein